MKLWTQYMARCANVTSVRYGGGNNCVCWSSWGTNFRPKISTTRPSGNSAVIAQCRRESTRGRYISCMWMEGMHHSVPIQYNDVIMGKKAPQITSVTIVCSPVYSGADQRKHQSSASLAFVQGIHRWPVNSPHKWPVTRKMYPFDDVTMLG